MKRIRPQTAQHKPEDRDRFAVAYSQNSLKTLFDKRSVSQVGGGNKRFIKKHLDLALMRSNRKKEFEHMLR